MASGKIIKLMSISYLSVIISCDSNQIYKENNLQITKDSTGIEKYFLSSKKDGDSIYTDSLYYKYKGYLSIRITSHDTSSYFNKEKFIQEATNFLTQKNIKKIESNYLENDSWRYIDFYTRSDSMIKYEPTSSFSIKVMPGEYYWRSKNPRNAIGN